jgi:hypothetical protein
VDKEEADDAIKDAWEFSGVLDDSSEWCDFDTMLFSTDTSNCAGLTDKSKDFEKQSIARKDNPPTSTKRIQNKRKDGKEGKISLCVLVFHI